MVFSNKKRFVAGAVCSHCHQQDVIVVFHESAQDWQACVACGYKEALPYNEDNNNHETNTIPLKPVDYP